MRTRRTLVLFSLILLSSSLFLALFGKKKFDPKPPLTVEEINGKALYRRFSVEEDYENYPYWPGHDGVRPGQSPHGDFHQIYVHPYLYDKLPIQSRVAPEGSIIVKCNLGAEKEIKVFTVMAKVKGYNPDAGDWFWAKISKEGDVLEEGKIVSCIDCHSALKDNDYLIIHKLERGK